MFSSTPTRLTLIISALSFIVSCTELGSTSVKSGRNDYNVALSESSTEELLLNIVRLRHSDKPYFIEVSSISATSEASATLGGSEEKGALGGISYLERPNIIYSPLTGEEFVRQLLTPVDLTTLTLLRGAGWEFDDILRVFVASINNLQNAPTAGSTPEGIPEYKEFLQVVEAIDELEDKSFLTFSAIDRNGEDQAVLHITPQGKQTKHFNILLDKLNLDPESEFYFIKTGIPRIEGVGEEIILQPRAILSSMFYLGQSIIMPEQIREDGEVNINHDPQGEEFNWQPMFRGLITIHSSSKKPDAYYVATRYRDYWYYIENSDISSKETMSMLSVLITLKAGGNAKSKPVLTLPVGG